MKKTKLLLWAVIASLIICCTPVFADNEPAEATEPVETEEIAETPAPAVDMPTANFKVKINLDGTSSLSYVDYVEKSMYDTYSSMGMKVESQFVSMLGDETNTQTKTEPKDGYYEISATRTYQKDETAFMLPKTIPGSAIAKNKGIFGTEYIINQYYPATSEGDDSVMFEVSVETPLKPSFVNGATETKGRTSTFIFKAGLENYVQIVAFVPNIISIIIGIVILLIIIAAVVFIFVNKNKKKTTAFDLETAPEYDENGELIISQEIEEILEEAEDCCEECAEEAEESIEEIEEEAEESIEEIEEEVQEVEEEPESENNDEE